jgi:hypothetical protein
MPIGKRRTDNGVAFMQCGGGSALLTIWHYVYRSCATVIAFSKRNRSLRNTLVLIPGSRIVMRVTTSLPPSPFRLFVNILCQEGMSPPTGERQFAALLGRKSTLKNFSGVQP